MKLNENQTDTIFVGIDRFADWIDLIYVHTFVGLC